jgi:GNAT superfamily N-acetyltransferase
MRRYEKVAIRELGPSDEPRLFALAEEAYGQQLPADETVAVLTRSVVFVAELPGEPEGSGDELAGYVALVEEGPELCIRQLLVAPAHDDSGIDRQLCEWAEGYAISRGCHRLRADVGDAELHERLFFRSRGFVQTAEGAIELRLPNADQSV